MRRKLRSGWGILGVAASILAFSISWAQAPGAQTQTPTAEAQAVPSKAPVIRTMTRLVQLSVVVSDKKGLPVTGLKPEDFTVLDGGQAQKIEIFKGAEPVEATQPIRTLPPNIFTNRRDKLGEPPGSKSILFLDALNTSLTEQELAREQVLKFLKTIQPQDHFAIYSLLNEDHVVIVHEFTQDDTALVKAIKEFAPKQAPPDVAPFAGPLDMVGMPEPTMHPLNAHVDYMRYRVVPEMAALIGIANHVAVIPGRKNLIWISAGVSGSSQRQPLPEKIKLADIGYRLSEPEYANTADELLKAVMESCNAANVVLYGVDVHGVTTTATNMDVSQRSSAGTRTGSVVPSPQGLNNANLGIMAREQNLRDTFRVLAEGTGGTAFYGNNNLPEGMQKAFDDGRYAYTIGYYPNHETWNGAFRKVEIKVARQDVHARYRDGYYAKEDIDGLQSDPEKQIQETGNSPLDSTALSMMVSVRHMKAQPASTLGAEHELEFQIGVDVAQLQLEQSGGHRKGSIDLVFIQRDEKGQALAAEKKHVDLDFTDTQYQGMLTAGAIFERHLVLNEQAKDVRVLVRDGGSGQIGTVTVALKNFVARATTGAAGAQAK